MPKTTVPDIIALIRAGVEVFAAFRKNNGRDPNDEELAAKLEERNAVEIEYLKELAAFRERHKV